MRPRPAITDDTAFFWRGAREHRLLVQRCSNCETLRHPPSAGCAECGSLEWDCIESAGRGTVFSFTVVHAPVTPPFEAGHVVALIELHEGTRLISELVGLGPLGAQIGMRVGVRWLDVDDELSLPAFAPMAEDA